MSYSRRDQQFHVVKAWPGSRYALDRRDGTSPPADSGKAEATPPTRVEMIEARHAVPPAVPTPALPHAAMASSATVPIDLKALLARRWLEQPAPSVPPAPLFHPPPPVQDSKDPIPVAPDPTPITERRPTFVASAPRRMRPWICPACRLNNAPWSKACTGCRSPAPPIMA